MIHVEVDEERFAPVAQHTAQRMTQEEQEERSDLQPFACSHAAVWCICLRVLTVRE
jgi:hypothetical protein